MLQFADNVEFLRHIEFLLSVVSGYNFLLFFPSLLINKTATMFLFPFYILINFWIVFQALVGSKTLDASTNTDHKTLLLQVRLS